MAYRLPAQRKQSWYALWFERLMALIAFTNFILVLFDYTYVSWRDIYVRGIPVPFSDSYIDLFPEWLYQNYDRLKGIEPHRDTERYLDTVAALEEQVAQTGLDSEEVEPILADLRQQSIQMIDENPFALSEQTGMLEKIKNAVRDRLEAESAKSAFREFWTQEYLISQGWKDEMEFFDRKVQPRLVINYYRNIGETGDFVDLFAAIDLPFTILFGVEFLARTWVISRRKPDVNWFEAWSWRWYDIFLWMPVIHPVIRLLRIIPVNVRLGQARTINFDPLLKQVNRGVTTHFAGEITEVVIIRTINYVQDFIKQGEITNWLTQANTRRYIDINDINEVEAISARLIDLSVYQVFPKIKSDLEALLHHSVTMALKENPVYRTMGQMGDRAVADIVARIVESLHQSVIAALNDPVGAELTNKLVSHFSDSLREEVQEESNLKEIELLLADLLEEVKINYVRRSLAEDFEDIVDQTHKIHEMVKPSYPGDR